MRKINPTRAIAVALGSIEALGHNAEIDIGGAEHVAYLTQHFLHTYVGTGVARAVVARKQQPQFFAGIPAPAQPEHPGEATHFDQRADPGNQQEIGHACALPAMMELCAASAEEG